MTREDWENIARCASMRRMEYIEDKERWVAEWWTWLMAQIKSGRTPF